MTLTDALTAEHVLIEEVAGALQTYVARRLAGGASADDGVRFFQFFRRWVGGYHHEREESVLFAALTGRLELPADRGPIHALTAQHHALEATLTELEPLLVASPTIAPEAHPAIETLTRAYAHGLWQHIDAENSVLFPESAARLRRAGLAGLASRTPTADEAAARDDGEALVRAFPPVHDAAALRGDGCFACPSYGTTCAGLERTWWTDSEWDELPSRADQIG